MANWINFIAPSGTDFSATPVTTQMIRIACENANALFKIKDEQAREDAIVALHRQVLKAWDDGYYNPLKTFHLTLNYLQAKIEGERSPAIPAPEAEPAAPAPVQPAPRTMAPIPDKR